MTTQSVRNYLSGVKYLHVSTGFDFPLYKAPELKLILRGLDHRLNMHLRVLRLSPCRYFECYCSVLLLRQPVPMWAKSFDPAKHLCRGDILLTSFGLLLTFKWSKTNQSGAKPLTLPLHSVSDPLLCPVHAYLLVCSCLPAPNAAPSFFTTRHSGSYTVVTKAVCFHLQGRPRMYRCS